MANKQDEQFKQLKKFFKIKDTSKTPDWRTLQSKEDGEYFFNKAEEKRKKRMLRRMTNEERLEYENINTWYFFWLNDF